MHIIPFIDFEGLPPWKILAGEILSQYFPSLHFSGEKLGSYSLVHILVDREDRPLRMDLENHDVPAFWAFTNEYLIGRAFMECSWDDIQQEKNLGQRPSEYHFKTMMLGELAQRLSFETKPAPIKINPVYIKLAGKNEAYHFCEEVVMAPIFDSFTKKYFMTDPRDAKALLAISPLDQSRYGIEFVFYQLTARSLPEEHSFREEILKEELEKMAFMVPRIPMKRGSASIIIVLLDLDNDLEESAFIRPYKTFDQYTDVLFVNSSLKLLTGQLHEIHYNGASIDSIFRPIIQWQQKNIENSINHR